jgi:hypothetical protein
MALLPPGSGGSGGEADVAHNDLPGRDQPNAHPISAVTGLADWLGRHDTAQTATGPLRYIFNFANVTRQEIYLPQPLDTPSLAIIVVRTSDGAMIEPEVLYRYSIAAQRYIERVQLSFNPPVSGEYFVHILR